MKAWIDAWSEAELLAEYQAAFGLDNADAIDAAHGIRIRWASECGH